MVFLVLVDCAACLDKCGLHVLCRKAHDSKMNRWHAVRNPSGYPALVWLLCRSCSTESSTEENANAQNSRVAVTPLILTTMYNCANPTLTCTSCKHRLCSLRAVIRIIRKSTSCGRGRDSRTTLRHRRQRGEGFNSHVPVEAGVESGTVLKVPSSAANLALVTTFGNTYKKSNLSSNASPCA